MATEMTLRDYYAGVALQALVGHPQYSGEMCKEAVKEAWLMADAMIEEKRK
jgi:hypothetical protein